jgi:hypothetical protein
MRKAKVATTSNKKVSQITFPDERYYRVDGVYLPSVTWILDSYPKGIGFYQWLASRGWDQAQAEKELAGDRGSKIHNAIQDLLKGKVVKFGDRYWSEVDNDYKPLTQEEWRALLTFERFWQDFKPGLVATERVCYSKKHRYAGTIDAVLLIDGKLTIVDWKSGSHIYPTYHMQTAAYLEAEIESGEFKAVQTAVVRLGTRHKVGYEVVINDNQSAKRHFRQFLAVKSVWSVENGDKKPDMVELPDSIKLTIKKFKKSDGKRAKTSNRKHS